VGLALSLRAPIQIELAPQLILALFVPPLVFEAAFHLNLTELWRNLRLVVLLAVPGVVVTMLIVAGLVAWTGSLALPTALVFGALIAASDPVSVLAIFRRIGAPKRLEILLEGESLLNDGTAIVLFNLALAAALAGTFRLEQGVVGFVVQAGGGVLVGAAMGWVVSRMIAAIDDYLVETTLTTVLAFGAFLLAEQIQLSGVLAVVAAGLVNGNLGRGGMSPTTRIVVFNFWEYVAFLANSAVFLLIGLRIDLPGLFAAGGPILWAIAAVLLGRAVIILLFSFLGGPMPARWKIPLFWGGLRGGIALALALSLPVALGPDRERVTLMTFGVVLFSLLVQGLSMHTLLRRLGIIERGEPQIEYERRHARAVASRASRAHLEQLRREGLISSHTWQLLEPMLDQRSEALARSVQEILRSVPELQKEEISTAQREALRSQRSVLADLRHDGVISDETYEQLVAEVDSAQDTGATSWAERLVDLGPSSAAQKVMLVVLEPQAVESVISATAAIGISATLMEDGDVPRLGPVAVLLGLGEGQEKAAEEILARHARAAAPDGGRQPTESSWFLLNLDGHREITT
jgi:CPA1 family monovalent cation:H+ antiporter